MSHVYLLDTDYTSLGRLDPSYSSFEIIRRYQDVDTFTMKIERRRLYADLIAEKRLLYVPSEDDALFTIESILTTINEEQDNLTVGGTSVDGFALTQRRVVPPVGSSHDVQTAVPAETAIKHYVDEHAGPSAPWARQVPGLVIAPDGAQGTNVSIAARFQFLLPVVQEIGYKTGIGWTSRFLIATDEVEFDVVVGVDRSAAVTFAFEFQTLATWQDLIDLKTSKSAVYVAGQGEGVDRDVVERWKDGVEPSGFDRREDFIDARDVALGSTALLEQRGDAYLAAASPERRLEAQAHQFGSFRYREHWWNGDIILVRSESRGLEYAARVVEVKLTWAESVVAPTIVATLDRPFPSLKDAMRVAGASAGPIVDATVGVGGGLTNLDGGAANAVYGGTTGIDGGAA